MRQRHDSSLDVPARKKKVRILALDGIRGLLALHIVCGHFLRFANPSSFWIKFCAQVNVTVGTFFALSGYVTAYTCTLVSENDTTVSFRSISRKQWWTSKALSFYPIHLFVLLLFGPIFVHSDLSAASASSLSNGLSTSVSNGILSLTLTQAWFPMTHAEIWNAPSWFLSSLLFCNLVLAVALSWVAKLHQKDLRILSVWLYIINLVPVLGYFWFVGENTWRLVEGMTKPKDHPSLGYFNLVRFFPVFNAAETLMGTVACRLVMLDSSMSRQEKKGKNARSSVIIPFGIVIGILFGRAFDWSPDCSDLIVRKFIVLPMFLNFVMALHRNALFAGNNFTTKQDPISAILTTKFMVWLGNLSFPIYILHGPIGQVFYKRAIATKLWGGVLKGKGYFSLYLATVLLAAILVQKLFSKHNFVTVVKRKILDWFS